MTSNPMETVDTSWKGLYRWGGISALISGVLIIVGIILYASVAPWPSGGEAFLKWLGSQTTLVYTTAGVFISTDILLVPVVLALYLALKGINKNAMLAAAGFVGLFVVLDLGVTLVSEVALTTLSQNYAAATSDVQRAAYVATANYALGIGFSGIAPPLSFGVLSLGILIASLVMLKGVFGKATAYVGIAASIAGFVEGIRLFVPALAISGAIAIVLLGIWSLLVGYRLYRLGK
jgi:hypothetical protein